MSGLADILYLYNTLVNLWADCLQFPSTRTSELIANYENLAKIQSKSCFPFLPEELADFSLQYLLDILPDKIKLSPKMSFIVDLISVNRVQQLHDDISIRSLSLQNSEEQLSGQVNEITALLDVLFAKLKQSSLDFSSEFTVLKDRQWDGFLFSLTPFTYLVALWKLLCENISILCKYANEDQVKDFIRVLLLMFPIKCETNHQTLLCMESINEDLLCRATFYEILPIRDLIVPVLLEELSTLIGTVFQGRSVEPSLQLYFDISSYLSLNKDTFNSKWFEGMSDKIAEMFATEKITEIIRDGQKQKKKSKKKRKNKEAELSKVHYIFILLHSFPSHYLPPLHQLCTFLSAMFLDYSLFLFPSACSSINKVSSCARLIMASFLSSIKKFKHVLFVKKILMSGWLIWLIQSEDVMSDSVVSIIEQFVRHKLDLHLPELENISTQSEEGESEIPVDTKENGIHQKVKTSNQEESAELAELFDFVFDFCWIHTNPPKTSFLSGVLSKAKFVSLVVIFMKGVINEFTKREVECKRKSVVKGNKFRFKITHQCLSFVKRCEDFLVLLVSEKNTIESGISTDDNESCALLYVFSNFETFIGDDVGLEQVTALLTQYESCLQTFFDLVRFLVQFQCLASSKFCLNDVDPYASDTVKLSKKQRRKRNRRISKEIAKETDKNLMVTEEIQQKKRWKIFNEQQIKSGTILSLLGKIMSLGSKLLTFLFPNNNFTTTPQNSESHAGLKDSVIQLFVFISSNFAKFSPILDPSIFSVLLDLTHHLFASLQFDDKIYKDYMVFGMSKMYLNLVGSANTPQIQQIGDKILSELSPLVSLPTLRAAMFASYLIFCINDDFRLKRVFGFLVSGLTEKMNNGIDRILENNKSVPRSQNLGNLEAVHIALNVITSVASHKEFKGNTRVRDALECIIPFISNGCIKSNFANMKKKGNQIQTMNAMTFIGFYHMLHKCLKYRLNETLSVIASFLNVVRCLLIAIFEYDTFSAQDNNEIYVACTANLSRLFSAMSQHPKSFNKYIPNVLLDYISLIKTQPLSLDNKKILLPGLYDLMNVCGDIEFKQLFVALDETEATCFKKTL